MGLWIFENTSGRTSGRGAFAEATDILVAESGSDLLLAYVPCNTKVCLNTDLSGWKIRVIDLAERFVACADFSVKEGKTIVEMHPFAQDALIVAGKTN